jgi:sulfur transfer complex TusBCD TusB component (DsrH family)
VNDPSEKLEGLASQLGRLRELLLVKNHKAPREIQEAVTLLAGELDVMATKLRRAAPVVGALPGEAAVQAHLALLEAKDKLTLLQDIVTRALQGAARSATFIGDVARVKVALGRMDATDLFEETRREWRAERERIENITQTAVRDLAERLSALTTAN